ncbi:MAG: alkaline phosphatase [Candidatus Eiseniibacteriota bacterium]
MRRWLTALAAVLLAACAREAREARVPSQDARVNVVFVVGDGFGMGAWSLARTWTSLHGEELEMDGAPSVGFLEARSLDHFVTDSGAAATAWSTGRLGPRFQVGFPGADVPTLFERLRAAGRAAGFVTTARVTHYTLAPFYARAAHRDEENGVAVQLVEALPDVAIGGGAGRFLPAEQGGDRADARDLLAEVSAKGAAVLRELDGPLPTDRPSLVVLSDSHLPHDLDRKEGEPDLAELAVAAVRRLQASGRPWFLLVESARIDHAGHDHDGASLLRNTLELDRALRAIRAATDPQRTLVVLGADHETANPTLLEFAHPESLDVVTASIEAMEERIFEGRSWTGTPRALAERALPVLDEGARHTGLAPEDLDRLVRARDVYERRTALGNALSRRFGVCFIAYEDHLRSEHVHGHNGDLVPVRAWGPRAEELRGVRDHAALGRWLAGVMGLPTEAGSPGSIDTGRTGG